jgi:hypothetical protein
MPVGFKSVWSGRNGSDNERECQAGANPLIERVSIVTPD